MKRWYQIGLTGVLVLLLLAAAGCSNKETKEMQQGNESVLESETGVEKETGNTEGTENVEEAVDAEEAEKSEQTESPAEAGEVGEALEFFTSPCSFVFSSGAGAWGTFLTLNGDGSFTGGYNDSDMGDTGAVYPHGKHYYCEFQGKFGGFKKIDENTISMTLEELTFQPEAGSEEIREEILYVGAEPYGLDSGTEFVLYLPDTSLTDLSEEFLSWWPGRYEWDGETERTLGCCGILNKETGAGFFSDAACTSCGAIAVSPQTGVCGKCGVAQ
ncbi:hypothetical protein D5278_02095 [bacterium 1XD21-13]|nr:hypothetical protein [bacterium 1XD21-13]